MFKSLDARLFFFVGKESIHSSDTANSTEATFHSPTPLLVRVKVLTDGILYSDVSLMRCADLAMSLCNHAQPHDLAPSCWFPSCKGTHVQCRSIGLALHNANGTLIP